MNQTDLLKILQYQTRVQQFLAELDPGIISSDEITREIDGSYTKYFDNEVGVHLENLISKPHLGFQLCDNRNTSLRGFIISITPMIGMPFGIGIHIPQMFMWMKNIAELLGFFIFSSRDIIVDLGSNNGSSKTQTISPFKIKKHKQDGKRYVYVFYVVDGMLITMIHLLQKDPKWKWWSYKLQSKNDFRVISDYLPNSPPLMFTYMILETDDGPPMKLYISDITYF